MPYLTNTFSFIKNKSPHRFSGILNSMVFSAEKFLSWVEKVVRYFEINSSRYSYCLALSKIFAITDCGIARQQNRVQVYRTKIYYCNVFFLFQTGAWGCFDEFNRINIEVLSVVAQQILSILSALSAAQQRFVFEGREINLIWSCGIFITMNPGQKIRCFLYFLPFVLEMKLTNHLGSKC